MTASEQMQQYVRDARESAKRAEREYDDAEVRIQRKSSQNIDLFGGSASRQVADIAAMCRKACENLYASYQMNVTMLDRNCRPLLAQDPDAEAVKAVADLIAWLNSESEIENNFSASFNSASLGDVANVRFFPSLENRMIEKFWIQKYHEMPEYIEAEKKRIEKQEAARQARQKEREAEKAAAAKFEKEKQERNERYKRVLADCKKREDELKKGLDRYINDFINKERVAVREVNRKKIAELERQKSGVNFSIAKLGMFQSAERKQLNAKLNEIDQKIAALRSDNSAGEAAGEIRDKADKAMKAYEEQVKDYMKRRFPYDERLYKERSKNMAGGIPDEKRDILDVLAEHGAGTVDDIMEWGRFDYSSQKLSALLRMLVLDGFVIRENIARQSFFYINDEAGEGAAKKDILGSGVDGYYENFSVTDDSMPVPPSVEEVMDS